MNKETSKALYEALAEYRERFGESFPTMFFRQLSTEDLLDMVQEHLDKDEKLELKLPKGALS